jgi:flagellar assembly protein FliH
MMEAAIHVEPFGFDRVFQVSGNEPETPDNAHELAEQLGEQQARFVALEEAHRAELARARADGFTAGLDQARHDREVAVLAAADAINAAIEQIDLRLDWVIETMTSDAAATALAAAEALAGHAVDHIPARAIDEALDRVLRQVARGTQLTVTVHPTLLDDVQRLVVERASQDRRKLSITALADDTTAPGDARIFWEEGGVMVSMAARRAAVQAELEPLLRGDAAEPA